MLRTRRDGRRRRTIPTTRVGTTGTTASGTVRTMRTMNGAVLTVRSENGMDTAHTGTITAGHGRVLRAWNIRRVGKNRR